jgi:hypothetical protein
LTLAGGGFAVGFLLLGEVRFGGLQVRLGLFEGDFSALRIERGQQLPRHYVLSLVHIDVSHRPARLEAEVQLTRRLQVAAAGHRRLHHPLCRRGGASHSRLLTGRRPHHEDGSDDRADAQSG